MESLEDGNAADAENEYTRAQKLIDSAERKGVLPKNRAARQKSRLMKRLNEIRG
jgi:ribosomal protein S20